MRKSELKKELDIYKFVAAHNIRWVEELKVPVVTPRKQADVNYLYRMYKENERK